MIAPAPASRGCFVEASAGTGKTTALVNAIADAIASGVPVDRIIAVTFTHQAAGEMKLRVRQKLEDLRTEATTAALHHLDRAFIGTIHSFCASLLRQRPVEACVDPDFIELDQQQARRFFNNVFREWMAGQLGCPTPAVRRAMARMAWRSDANAPLLDLEHAAWNLAEWRDYKAPWSKREIQRETRIDQLLAQLEALLSLWAQNEAFWARKILEDTLKGLRRSREVGTFDVDNAESELISLTRRLESVKLASKSEAGKKWADLLDLINEFRRDADADLVSYLRDDLWTVVEAYQAAKQREGALDFTDLLLYARTLVRHSGACRDLQARFDRFFIDEFQDTDPLQAEILTTLARPDQLFVVGDPKQSIYRFRRAEPAVYAQVRQELVEQGNAEQKFLHESHRSTAAIQEFVNAAFRDMPEYLPLTGGPAEPSDQPSVLALPIPNPYENDRLKDTAILQCSPGTVAAFIWWLVRKSGWTVRTRTGRRPVQADDVCILFRRFVNNGVDLTQEYVRGLESRGIDHVLVGSKGLHSREEISALRTALRAIEWPEDELSVYGFLRGPFEGIDDATLLRFRSRYLRLSPFADREDDDIDFDPVWRALDVIRDLHRQRNHFPLADTIRRLLHAVRGHVTLAFQSGSPRKLANVHRLAELARGFDASGAGSFREFVQWLEEEAESGESSEAPVLEQQIKGVRLMSVHRAKGLEFPVVILADMSAKLCPLRGGDRWLDPAGDLCAQKLLHCVPWEMRDRAEEIEAAERAEAVRLAYVAATRAQDLLVVCAIGDTEYKDGWLSPLYDALYPSRNERRKAAPAPGCPEFGEETVLNAPVLPEQEQIKPGLHQPRAGNHRVTWFDPALLQLRAPAQQGSDEKRFALLQGTPDQVRSGLDRYEGWVNARATRVEQGSAPQFRIRRASAAEPIAEAAHIDVEVVNVSVGAAGASGRTFGRLLHSALQAGGAVEVHARRWGANASEVSAVQTAFAAVWQHPLVQGGDAVERYRELPLMVRLQDGTLVEGRADLAWHDSQRWTVIDFKTDKADRARYRRQLQAYGLALERATGMPARCVLMEIG